MSPYVSPLRFALRALIFLGALGSIRAAPATADGVGFEQRLGESLPLAAQFTDTRGQPHRLRDFFRGQPVVLLFGYARCPQLCPVVTDGTVAALRALKAGVGRDLDVISISIDPDETCAMARAREADAMHRYGDPRAAEGWHFLVGRADAIRAVADAAGFRYTYDPRSRQYAHPAGAIVLRPDGVISRYFIGLDLPPAEMAVAIREAAEGGTGPRALDVLLRCFRGDGVSGRYGAIIWRVLGGAVTLTVLALGGFIGWMLREERRALARTREGAP